MKVLYAAPTRAHHYKYAAMLQKHGMLYKFVSGFPRLSPRAKLAEIGNRLIKADFLQTLFLLSNRLKFPKQLCDQLAYVAKLEIDRTCKKLVDGADIFIFYNGAGLDTATYAKQKGIITVVEAVNSHVCYQEQLLENEYELTGLSWRPFHKVEKLRRIKEYDLADYILLPSNFVKKSFIELGYPESKLIKVPYGFNSFSQSTVKPRTDVKKDFNILFVGSVSVRKGVRYLIEAFNMIDHPHKKLTIVGAKNTPDGLSDLVIPYGVDFTGILKGEELEREYRKADVFCLPSIEEGLALVLGEALSYGIPIVATENTGANDIITDGDEGFIVPIRDSKSIASKIQKLINDRDLYETMKSKATQRATNLMGWEVSGEQLVHELYNIYNRNK